MVLRDAIDTPLEPAVTDTSASEPAEDRPVMLVPLFASSDVRAGVPVLRALARARGADVLLLDLEQPAHRAAVQNRDAWLEERRAALEAPDVSVRAEHRVGHNLQGMISEAVAEHAPELLVFTWQRSGVRSPLRDELALSDLLVDVPCDVFVLGFDGEVREPRRVALALMADDDDAEREAVRETGVAVAATVDGSVIFMGVGDGHGAERARELEAEVAELPDPSRGSVRVIASRSAAEGIVQAASPEEIDLLVIGTPRSGVIHRLSIRNVTERVTKRAAVPVLVVKPRRSIARSALSRMTDAVLKMFPTLDESAKVEVYRSVRTSARGNVDFHVMMALATAIATLGLLLNSAAVVIGGMLVAPLMAPLVSLGLGMVQGDARLLRLSLVSALRGSLLSIAIGALLTVIVPNAELTAEVAARTRPSLLDLGVAFAAGAAGAYALSRERLSAALPGVAIAAALVPPLAAVGVGLALFDLGAAGGAALLFAANFVSITSAAGVVFFIVGFRPEPEQAPRLKLFTRGFTALALLALAVAVPLTWLTVDSVRAANLQRDTRTALDVALLQLPGVRWTAVDVGRSEDGTMRLTVDMETPGPLEAAQVAEIEQVIEARLRRVVDLAVRLIQVTEVRSGGAPASTPEAGD